jgi:hypothetical protein
MTCIDNQAKASGEVQVAFCGKPTINEKKLISEDDSIIILII